jgi:hypothetical protein
MNEVTLRTRIVVLVWAALLSLSAAGALAAYDDAPDDAPMVVQPTPLGNERPEFAAGEGGGTASANALNQHSTVAAPKTTVTAAPSAQQNPTAVAVADTDPEDS